MPHQVDEDTGKRMSLPRELIAVDIEYPRLKELIMGISNLDHQALLALTYGTGARIGEVVRHRKDLLTAPISSWRNPPISVDMIKKDVTPKGHKMIVIKLQMEKVRNPKYKYRRTIIRQDYEPWLVTLILNQRDRVKMKGLKFLFDYSTGHAQSIFARYIGKYFPRENGVASKNIHVLRDWRITHWLRGAVTGKPVQNDRVARLTGHTSVLTQSKYYDLSTVEQYADYI